MAQEKETKKKKSTEEKVLHKRRISVLLVMAELTLCLTLGIGAVVVNRTVNAVNIVDLDDDVYKATINQPTVMSVAYEDITDAAGEVVDRKEIYIPVDTNEKVYRNILIVGIDARNMLKFDDGGTNTDVMMIASINNITGEVKLVSILRDTVMHMEASAKTEYNKANSQYYYGISDVVSMMNRNLDLDIEEYVIVNWYGVAVCVNQLGGIEMTIKDDKQLQWFNGYLTAVNNATGIWAPQLNAPGTYVMSGTQLVAYCRIRYGGLNDTGRTSNQREAIGKMLEKAKSIVKSGDVGTILNVAQTGLSNVMTNLTLPEIAYLASNVEKYSMTGSRQFPMNYTSGESTGNFIAKYGINLNWGIIPNDLAQEVRDLHEFLFNDSNYKVSDFVQKTSYQMYLDRTGQ